MEGMPRFARSCCALASRAGAARVAAAAAAAVPGAAAAVGALRLALDLMRSRYSRVLCAPLLAEPASHATQHTWTEGLALRRRKHSTAKEHGMAWHGMPWWRRRRSKTRMRSPVRRLPRPFASTSPRARRSARRRLYSRRFSIFARGSMLLPVAFLSMPLVPAPGHAAGGKSGARVTMGA